jgi:hypothetical protein
MRMLGVWRSRAPDATPRRVPPATGAAITPTLTPQQSGNTNRRTRRWIDTGWRVGVDGTILELSF